MIKNKLMKYTNYLKKYDEDFNKFQNTAIGKFIIEKLILRVKSFYSILFTFGLILVAQISAFNNIIQWSDKVDEQLNHSDGWAYTGWFIISFIVPSGNMLVIVVLVIILIMALIIRYKELTEDGEIAVQKNKNKLFLKELEYKSKNYVITENHSKIITKLEKSHVVVISGEPGIGKTTLAENIILSYVKQGFKFFEIKDSINAEFHICQKNEKQIFYFDDFLGSNYLKVIENKQTSNIVKFINIIKKDKNKRFILTSRTNIFNQSLLLADIFKDQNIDNNEFILQIKNLSDIEKAHILHRHLFNNGLSREFTDEVCKDKRYKEIINHKNFNPRLIAFITNIDKIEKEQIEAEGYWEYILRKLNNPQDIWKNTFDKQSDSFTRAIVILTVFNGNKIREEELRDSYYRYIELAGLNSSSHTSKEFDSIIEEVVKYFLNRNQIYNKRIEYSLFNPSIADFVLNRYRNNLMILKNIYKSLENDKALVSLFTLNKNGFIRYEDYLGILNLLLNEASIEKSPDYLIKLYRLAHRASILNINQTLLKILIQKIINGEVRTKWIEDYYELVKLFNVNQFHVNDFDFFLDLIFYANNDIDDINTVIKLYNFFSVQDSNVDRELNELITEYFKEELINEADGIYESDVGFEESMNDKGYFEVIDGEIEWIIDNKYSELEESLEYFSGLDIDEDEIKDEIDISDIKERLSSDYTSEKYNDFTREKDEEEYSSSSFEKDDIENLFDK
ncbi:ATP-binding protein [Aliarcobacter butzleri]|nr:ATP-binding protein [Aliarcobacter butzleri]